MSCWLTKVDTHTLLLHVRINLYTMDNPGYSSTTIDRPVRCDCRFKSLEGDAWSAERAQIDVAILGRCSLRRC